jgi:hypothetical protein
VPEADWIFFFILHHLGKVGLAGLAGADEISQFVAGAGVRCSGQQQGGKGKE